MRISRGLALSFVAVAALCGPVSAEPDHAEITYWESVRDSKTPAELEAYLKAYPDGAFTPLARIRLKALQGRRGNRTRLQTGDRATMGRAAPTTDTAKGRAEETETAPKASR